MMDKKEDVRVMLRLPHDLHTDVMQFAQGGGKRPKSSLNATLVFLLRVGLAQQRLQEQREHELEGNSQPVPLAA